MSHTESDEKWAEEQVKDIGPVGDPARFIAKSNLLLGCAHVRAEMEPKLSALTKTHEQTLHALEVREGAFVSKSHANKIDQDALSLPTPKAVERVRVLEKVVKAAKAFCASGAQVSPSWLTYDLDMALNELDSLECGE